MIIAKRVPESVGVPVWSGENEVEIYYSRPVNLGKVNRVGSYWYTVDGRRFTSSRDAMAYLVALYEAGVELTPRTEEPRERLQVRVREEQGEPQVQSTSGISERERARREKISRTLRERNEKIRRARELAGKRVRNLRAEDIPEDILSKILDILNRRQ